MELSKMLPTSRLPPSSFLLAVTATTFFLLFMAAEARWPILYRVGGGRSTWEPNANLTLWASQKEIYVGDWLYFGFNKTLYDVLEVNRTGYDRCSGEGFITNITRGGRDVFNLTQARPYYFICSRGSYCAMQGMKMEVNVTTEPPPPQQPRPVESSSGSPLFPRCGFTSAVLFLVLGVLSSSGALFAGM
ncbi:unnamed protein product [Linum trigynum]|uniref:Phytocyanin domain-containing protein n=2 Tax=Linum trigynum TaxID=586398 RepID=A0AAV2D4E3_9ROSI